MSIVAGVHRDVEASFVSLHHINRLALTIVMSQRVLCAHFSELDEVDAGHAAAIHLAQVYKVGK